MTGALTGAGTLTATASETITVGADFTPAAFTRATSTVLLDWGTAANLGGLTFYNLTIDKSATADTVSSTGALTVTNALTLTQGTWLASSFTHTIAGAWDSSAAAFTFTADTSTISLSPTATPNIKTKGIGTDPFYNLTLAAGGSLQSAVQATNNLTITAGTLTLNANNLTVGVNLSGNALTATATEAISVGGNWNIASFTPVHSNVTFNGGADSIQTPTTFWDLTIQPGAGNTVTLAADIIITDHVTIVNGTLSALAHQITMQGNLWNNAGGTSTRNRDGAVHHRDHRDHRWLQ